MAQPIALFSLSGQMAGKKDILKKTLFKHPLNKLKRGTRKEKMNKACKSNDVAIDFSKHFDKKGI